jgi:hypothetical protein
MPTKSDLQKMYGGLMSTAPRPLPGHGQAGKLPAKTPGQEKGVPPVPAGVNPRDWANPTWRAIWTKQHGEKKSIDNTSPSNRPLPGHGQAGKLKAPVPTGKAPGFVGDLLKRRRDERDAAARKARIGK